MTQLREVASVIRSKNAGPFCLTLDLMFEDERLYRHVVNSAVISSESIARLYHRSVDQVAVITHDASRAIKVAMARLVPAGDLDDTDIYGTQQHVPLLALEIPDGY